MANYRKLLIASILTLATGFFLDIIIVLNILPENYYIYSFLAYVIILIGVSIFLLTYYTYLGEKYYR